LAQGRRIVGFKVGLTARSVQQQMGVDQPDFGVLFDAADIPLGAEIPVSLLRSPRVEAEIAVILGQDLDSDTLTSADILVSVEYVVAAIEVVDTRIVN
jgi:2-keto-4-pentenoate hydratase